MFNNIKTYELTLTKNYVSAWGMSEAVRELIQNALDSDSPFEYAFDGSYEQGMTLSLRSEYSLLTPQSLLLGVTSKADNDSKIGSFGEGYKIAMLVLTRLGYDMDIINGPVVWKPRFKFNRQFGEELLAVEEIPHRDPTHKGLTFQVHGLSVEDCEAIVKSCIRMQDSTGAIRHTKMGDILLDRPGELYVGGLWVCTTEMEVGYNVKPEFLTLERDRQTVNQWHLTSLTKDMWIDSEEWDRIAEMTERGAPDVEDLRYGSPEVVRKACYDRFKAEYPDAVVASNQRELDELIERGMTNVVIVKDTYHTLISNSDAYEEAHPDVKAPPPPTCREVLTRGSDALAGR